MKKQILIEKIGVELALNVERLGDDVQLSSLSAWDSMGQIAVTALIDNEFGTQLPSGALQRCKTVKDITDLLAAHLEQ